MSSAEGVEAGALLLSVAFVGSLLPEEVLADYAAASLPGIRFQHGVLEALRAADIDTSVISLRPVSSYPRSPHLFFLGVNGTLDEGVPYRQIGFINAGPLKTLTAAFSTLCALLGWARRHRHERRVILLYNTYNPSGWVGILAAWVTRSRIVAIVADLNVPGSGDVGASFLRRVEYRLAVASLRRMHAIVPVTRAIAADFAAQVPFLQLDGGIPQDLHARLPVKVTAKVHACVDAAQTSETDPVVIAYAGRLTSFAGVPLLLEAFRRLRNPHFQLWIAGRGHLEAEVRRAAGADVRIHYLGLLTRSDLLAMYSAADLLVNPQSTVLLTARYVFPSKLLEYLATGRPVLTTGTPEIVAAYGALCTVLQREEPQALADAIARIAAEPPADRLAKAEAARVAVIERRTWQRQGRRLVQFLLERCCD